MGDLVELHSRERSALIDEYGERKRREAGYQRELDHTAEIGKIIAGWYTESDPAESFLIEGSRYQATIGPKANQRVIVNMRKLFRTLGQSQFLNACTFQLKALDRFAPIPGIVEQSRTGPRKIEVVALLPAGKGEAA